MAFNSIRRRWFLPPSSPARWLFQRGAVKPHRKITEAVRAFGVFPGPVESPAEPALPQPGSGAYRLRLLLNLQKWEACFGRRRIRSSNRQAGFGERRMSSALPVGSDVYGIGYGWERGGRWRKVVRSGRMQRLKVDFRRECTPRWKSAPASPHTGMPFSKGSVEELFGGKRGFNIQLFL